MGAKTTSICEWLGYGRQWEGIDPCGITYLDSGALSILFWFIATNILGCFLDEC